MGGCSQRGAAGRLTGSRASYVMDWGAIRLALVGSKLEGGTNFREAGGY